MNNISQEMAIKKTLFMIAPILGKSDLKFLGTIGLLQFLVLLKSRKTNEWKNYAILVIFWYSCYSEKYMIKYHTHPTFYS